MGLFDYTPYESKTDLFGGDDSSGSYDPYSYTPSSYETPDLFSDLFGGDDSSGSYDPYSYTPYDSSPFDYDFGSDSGLGSLDSYDPSSYNPFSYETPDFFGGGGGGDDSGVGSIDDIIGDIWDQYNEENSGPPLDAFMTDEEREAAGGAGADSETGPFGGQFGPWLRNLFVGSGSGPLNGNILGGGEGGGGILGAILGLGGGGGGQGGEGGGGGGLGGLLGGLAGGNPLLTFLAMKSLLKDEPSAEGSVPIGGEAYGGPKFNYQDYQPTNLQPALMPGVNYSNQGGVPGMMGGGSTDQRPGDITFAKLEPGEFVIQKPAVDAVGIETLEQINNMGNGRSYNG